MGGGGGGNHLPFSWVDSCSEVSVPFTLHGEGKGWLVELLGGQRIDGPERLY